ncbi:hypothetical protein J2W76_005005 [Methylorubrum zatmanii]|nr:hypothetical protein [Methylorubrum zatmanii]MCP1556640.1 hypothetical protein [Methylorubrum extorquens]MCP1581729.1 hypothetical protein [Methylorubrum extorquens]
MPTENPELAWRIMAATAMDQDRLKAEAGVKASGRKSAASVYSYSLAWHPDEKRNLSKSEMLRAADESLKAIGAHDRQALIVCHGDEPHPHVHVIVNRVSPEDGRMLSTSNDRVKLSEWAQAYEQERGRIWCHERVANNAKRAQGDFVRASSPTPRSMEKEFDEARGADPVAAKRERDEAKARAGKLASAGRGMAQRHRAEWDGLAKRHRDRKAEIRAQARAAGDRAYEQIREQYRPQWQELYRNQMRDKRRFVKLEAEGALGRLANIYHELRASARGEGEKRSVLAAGFNLLISKDTRELALMERHKRERDKLQAVQRRDVKDAKAIIARDQTPLQERTRKSFMSERTALIDRQAEERGDLKNQWKQEGDRRSRSFDTITRKTGVRQKAKTEATPEERAESWQRRENFQAASQGRPARQSRMRSRKRTRKGK